MTRQSVTEIQAASAASLFNKFRAELGGFSLLLGIGGGETTGPMTASRSAEDLS